MAEENFSAGYCYFVFVTTLGQCNSGNLVCLGVFAAGHSSANKKQMHSKTQSPLADFHYNNVFGQIVQNISQRRRSAAKKGWSVHNSPREKLKQNLHKIQVLHRKFLRIAIRNKLGSIRNQFLCRHHHWAKSNKGSSSLAIYNKGLLASALLFLKGSQISKQRQLH